MGLGVYQYRDGTVYQGEWDANVKLGFGILMRTDGHIYVGFWDSNRPDGPGVYFFSNRYE
jgi:hypothetical protein